MADGAVQHLEPFARQHEPIAFVERDGSLVRQLRIDMCGVGAVLPGPTQRVLHQGASPPLPLSLGVHGDALHVGVSSGQPGDVIANDRLGAGHLKSMPWRCSHRVGQAGPIELPEVVERQRIEHEHVGVVEPPASP